MFKNGRLELEIDKSSWENMIPTLLFGLPLDGLYKFNLWKGVRKVPGKPMIQINFWNIFEISSQHIFEIRQNNFEIIVQ